MVPEGLGVGCELAERTARPSRSRVRWWRKSSEKRGQKQVALYSLDVNGRENARTAAMRHGSSGPGDFENKAALSGCSHWEPIVPFLGVAILLAHFAWGVCFRMFALEAEAKTLCRFAGEL